MTRLSTNDVVSCFAGQIIHPLLVSVESTNKLYLNCRWNQRCDSIFYPLDVERMANGVKLLFVLRNFLQFLSVLRNFLLAHWELGSNHKSRWLHTFFISSAGFIGTFDKFFWHLPLCKGVCFKDCGQKVVSKMPNNFCACNCSGCDHGNKVLQLIMKKVNAN